MAVSSINGVEISMPMMERNVQLDMERCAEFLARMIRKYGNEVLAEIDAEGGGSIKHR